MILTSLFYTYIQENFQNHKGIYISMMLINFLAYILFSYQVYFILSIFMIISVIDLNENIIPNYLVISLAALSLVSTNLNFSMMDLFILLLLFILLCLSLATKTIGMGDIKLLFAIYLLLGSENFLVFLFYLSILIFVFAIVLLIKNKPNQKSFPLGPLITLAVILLGAKI